MKDKTDTNGNFRTLSATLLTLFIETRTNYAPHSLEFPCLIYITFFYPLYRQDTPCNCKLGPERQSKSKETRKTI